MVNATISISNFYSKLINWIFSVPTQLIQLQLPKIAQLFGYTGWPPKKTEQSIQSIFQDFALINSFFFHLA